MIDFVIVSNMAEKYQMMKSDLPLPKEYDTKCHHRVENGPIRFNSVLLNLVRKVGPRALVRGRIQGSCPWA